MTFFFDECVSKILVEAMTRLVKPICVIHLRHKFGKAVKDTVWIPYVGEHGWVLLTCDGRIRHNTPEYEALKKANIVSIFIPKEYPRWHIWDQVVWIVKHWQKIVSAASNADSGTMLHIDARCRIVETRDWRHGRTR